MTFEQQVRDMWEQAESVSYNLHPPLLRALGLKKKLKLGLVVSGTAVAARADEELCAERLSTRSAMRRSGAKSAR